MKKKKLLSQSRNSYEIQDKEIDPGEIVFRAGNWLDDNSEMIRITKEGFWVRGNKVPQDDQEAVIVYNAFKEWMVWSAMTRKY